MFCMNALVANRTWGFGLIDWLTCCSWDATSLYLKLFRNHAAGLEVGDKGYAWYQRSVYIVRM